MPEPALEERPTDVAVLPGQPVEDAIYPADLDVRIVEEQDLLPLDSAAPEVWLG